MRPDGLAALAVMLDRADSAAVWHANHHVHGVASAGAIAESGDMILNLVKRVVAEPGELHLADRLEAIHAQANRQSGDGGLGDRRVDHAVLAELLPQPFGYAEDALVRTNVLA